LKFKFKKIGVRSQKPGVEGIGNGSREWAVETQNSELRTDLPFYLFHPGSPESLGDSLLFHQ
jgi:hypothetical protein